MTVYLVYGWDPMASNTGDSYLEGVYLREADAKARTDALNTADRASFMARCSPGAESNYHDQNHMVATEVK